MGAIAPSAATRRGYVTIVALAVLLVASAGAVTWLRIESATAERYVLGLTGVASLSLLGVGAVTTRTVIGPLGRLRAEVESLAADDGRITVGLDRSDELGRLARGVAELEGKRAELRTARRDEQERREAAERRLERFEETASTYSETLRRRTDEPLTQRLDAECENDALSDLAAAYNDRVGELETTVDRLAELVGDVASSVAAISDGTTALESADRGVTESVDRIAEKTEAQHDELDTAIEQLDELASTVQGIARASNRVADVAQRTAETGQSGHEAAQAAIEGMAAIEQETDDAVSQLQALESEVAQIDELTTRIADIARETSMLALNANIEASRSDGGGDGQGFGVVASEVKELSTDVQEAAEEIETRLESIRAQTTRSVTQVEDTSDNVERVRSSVDETMTALVEIAELAERTNDGVRTISATTREQATATEEIVSTVDDARTATERIGEETRTAASLAHDRRDASARVARNANDLSRRADQLRTIVEQFPATGDEASEGGRTTTDTGGRSDERDAYALKRAVIDAHPEGDTPWHTFGRIELETGCDLAAIGPGDTLSADRYGSVIAAVEDLLGHPIDPDADPAGRSAIPLGEE